MPMHDTEAYCFGSFRLVPGRRVLLRGGAPVQLGSRAFDLLVALVKRQGQLATKDELLAEVWLGTGNEGATRQPVARGERRLADWLGVM